MNIALVVLFQFLVDIWCVSKIVEIVRHLKNNK